MGIFRNKTDKELELVVSDLNSCLVKHYEDWDWVLKMNIGPESASQQPLEGVVKAVRLMWIECFARSVYISTDSHDRYSSVLRRVPRLESVLSESEFGKYEFQQATRIIDRMKLLISQIGSLKPSYAETLESTLREPVISQNQERARRVLENALSKGPFDTKTEMFIKKGWSLENGNATLEDLGW